MTMQHNDEQIPEAEVSNLAKSIQPHLDSSWDLQLETDLNAGKLDALIARAEAEIETKQVRNLN